MCVRIKEKSNGIGVESFCWGVVMIGIDSGVASMDKGENSRLKSGGNNYWFYKWLSCVWVYILYKV